MRESNFTYLLNIKNLIRSNEINRSNSNNKSQENNYEKIKEKIDHSKNIAKSNSITNYNQNNKNLYLQKFINISNKEINENSKLLNQNNFSALSQNNSIMLSDSFFDDDEELVKLYGDNNTNIPQNNLKKKYFKKLEYNINRSYSSYAFENTVNVASTKTYHLKGLYKRGLESMKNRQIIYEENLRRKENLLFNQNSFKPHIKSYRSNSEKKIPFYERSIKWKNSIYTKTLIRKENNISFEKSFCTFKPETSKRMRNDEEFISKNSKQIMEYILKRRNFLKVKEDEIRYAESKFYYEKNYKAKPTIHKEFRFSEKNSRKNKNIKPIILHNVESLKRLRKELKTSIYFQDKYI